MIPLAPEDVERIRAQLLATGDLRSATLVSVLAYAGLRPGEALPVRGWATVDAIRPGPRDIPANLSL